MLSKIHRFHGLGSLNFAYKNGQTVRAPLLSLKYARNPRRTTYRLAVVVSRKVSKSAVSRNRIRRRVYEAAGAEIGTRDAPYDLLITAFSDQVASATFGELQRQVRSLLAKSGVFGPAKPGTHGIVENKGA